MRPKHFILEDCRSHLHSCDSKCISQNMLPKPQIFVCTVAAIWKSFVIKRTNSYLYYAQKWSTWRQQSVVNTDYSTEERNSVKACTWATVATVTIPVSGSLAFIQSRNTQFSLLSPLWKSLTKKAHNKPQQGLLQQRKAWHTLPRIDASLRKRQSVPSLPEQEGVGGLGAMDTAKSSVWQRPQGDSKHTRDLHGAGDSHQGTGQIFRFFLNMTSSYHRSHKSFLFPSPAYPWLLSCH